MTYLCIGRSGQVASALRERADIRKIALVNVGRPDVDLLDSLSCEAIIKQYSPTIVINAAAYTNVDLAETEPDAAIAMNADAPGALAAVCKRLDLPIIHISTDYVFDGSLDHPYKEIDETGPINAYGRSKLAGEKAVRAGNEKHIILRTSWVYSPFGNNFVATMLRLARERGGAGVVDDQYGTPTSALDIADTLLDIAEKLSSETYGTYHFTAAGKGTWADFADLIFSIYDEKTSSNTALKRITTAEFPTPARRPEYSRLSTQKLENAFGIIPRRWEDSVRETVNRILEDSGHKT